MTKRRGMGAILFAMCLMAYPAIGSAASIEIVQMDAGHTLLNFDELAHGAAVTNQYAALGVTVSGSLGNNGTGAASTVSAYQTGNAFSDPIYIGQPNNNWDGSIIFTFSKFVDQVGMISVDSANTWLSVYDVNNNLIETVFGSGAVYDFIGIDTNGVAIKTAIISGDFYAVDDLRFNAPEPATLLLLGGGLLGTALVRRRRTSVR